MAESANVEVVISAFTSAAKEAVESVGDELNNLSADAQPAQSAMDEVADEMDDATTSAAANQAALDEVASEAASAAVANQALQSSVDEAGDEMSSSAARAGILSGAYSRLSFSAGNATFSTGALSAALTASLIPALLTTSTILFPLAATLGVVAAGALSLAGAFGVLVGTGVVTHMEELKAAVADVKGPIMDAIAPLGEVLGPLLVEAVRALPELVRNIVAAIGPLDEFRSTLVELGGMAMDVIPSMVGAMFDLARIALPVFQDLVSYIQGQGTGAFQMLMDVTRETGPLFLDLASAVAGLVPELMEVGTIVANLILPPLSNAIGVIDRALSWFLDLSDGVKRLGIAGAITAPAILSVASALGSLLGPVGLAAAAVAAFAAAYRSNFMGIQDITNSVIGDVVSWLSQFSDEAQAYLDAITGAVDSFAAGFSDGFSSMDGPAGALAKNLQGLAGDVTDLANTFASTLQPLAMRVIDTFSQQGDQFRALGQTFTQITNGIVTAIRGIVSVVQFVFKNYTAQVLEGMVGLYETHFGTIMTEVNQTLQALMGYFQVFVGAANGIWSKWGDEITAVAKFVFDILSATILNALDSLITVLLVVLDLIQGDFGSAWEKLAALFERVTGRIMDVITGWGIVDAIKGAFSAVIQTGIDWAKGFLDVILNAVATVTAVLDKMSNTIYNVFATMFNALLELGSGAFEGIINLVIDGVNTVISKANDAIEEANKLPGINFSELSSIGSVNFDTRQLQLDKRETDMAALRQKRREQLDVLLDFDVSGDGPLADFVDQSAEAKVQGQETQNERVIRRQNIGGGPVGTR